MFGSHTNTSNLVIVHLYTVNMRDGKTDDGGVMDVLRRKANSSPQMKDSFTIVMEDI